MLWKWVNDHLGPVVVVTLAVLGWIAAMVRWWFGVNRDLDSLQKRLKSLEETRDNTLPKFFRVETKVESLERTTERLIELIELDQERRVKEQRDSEDRLVQAVRAENQRLINQVRGKYGD